MGAKVNLVLDDDVKAELERLVPAGERSRFASKAIAASLVRVRRERAIAHLDALRAAGPTLPTGDVVAAVRELREGRK
jgi:predicted transcriptional regulator